MSLLLSSATPSPTLSSPAAGGWGSPMSSPRPSNASPAPLVSRLPSTVRSRTASRLGCGGATSAIGGLSSRRQSRSRWSMSMASSDDGGPLDPPFTEGDILTPYQSLPASSSSAPLLPVRSPSQSTFGGGSSDSSPEGTVDGDGDPAVRSLEIVRKLGTGSYAVVYLVREVLAGKDSPSSDDDLFDGLDGDDVAAGARAKRVYGREFGASHPLLPRPASFSPLS